MPRGAESVRQVTSRLLHLSARVPWLLGALPTVLPRGTMRHIRDPDDGALSEVNERFESVTTFTDRDPATHAPERRRRVMARRTNAGSANVSTTLLVIPSKNGRSVASPAFPSIEDLELAEGLALNARKIRISGCGKLPATML